MNRGHTTPTSEPTPSVSDEGAEQENPAGDFGTVTVCPACDSAELWRSSRRAGGEAADGRWRCEACGHRFDDPDERERRSAPRGGAGSVHRALEEMDPGDLVTDGGDGR